MDQMGVVAEQQVGSMMRSAAGPETLAQERFGRFAQGYVTSQTHAKGAELDRLVEIAQPQPDWVVLDVATGGGHTALRFAASVAQIVATDITPRMLEKAEAFIAGKGTGNVTYELADAGDLAFEDEAFDLVTCRIAPHHFPDCSRFVREGARVLKAGGLLLVQDHVLPEDQQTARYVDAFEKLRDPSHHRAFSESEWVAMIHAAGLTVEHTEQIVKRHAFQPWAERQGCTPETVEQLSNMMVQAPEAAVAWLQPLSFGTPDASFANHHILVAGRKGKTVPVEGGKR
jgi:ubiquinone/menaquinone biosynthesis C-methylase UbiE